MNDLEVMKHARNYLDSLAQVVDPLTGEILTDDSILNNVRISRCFSYISTVMTKVIENGGEVTCVQITKPNKKERFTITDEQILKVPLSDCPISIKTICENITTTVNNIDMMPLGAGRITKWLETHGYLVFQEQENGSRQRVPTEMGRDLGISVQGISNFYGVTQMNLYNKHAQEFIITHILVIINSK